MGSPEPLIFPLQHFCVHDGPGIRSLVFFKGCPLRCVWCQNVESWKVEAEIGFKAHLCIACGRCVEGCPERAIAGPGQRDASRCRLCFTCVQACPSGAMARFGLRMTAEEIVAELRPEFSLHRDSGGGVTFTGGEPALFPEFATALARLLRSEGIPVALETCGLFNPGRLKPLLAELQLVLFDIKVCDGEHHRLLCGSENTVIKENLRSLAQAASTGEGPPVWPRLPLVPGMTDGPANIRSWAGLLRDVGATFVTIVPYHPKGVVKRAWLGQPSGPDLPVPSDGEIAAAAELFAGEGIRAFRPGEEDFPGDTLAGRASASG